MRPFYDWTVESESALLGQPGEASACLYIDRASDPARDHDMRWRFRVLVGRPGAAIARRHPWTFADSHEEARAEARRVGDALLAELEAEAEAAA